MSNIKNVRYEAITERTDYRNQIAFIIIIIFKLQAIWVFHNCYLGIFNVTHITTNTVSIRNFSFLPYVAGATININVRLYSHLGMWTHVMYPVCMCVCVWPVYMCMCVYLCAGDGLSRSRTNTGVGDPGSAAINSNRCCNPSHRSADRRAARGVRTRVPTGEVEEQGEGMMLRDSVWHRCIRQWKGTGTRDSTRIGWDFSFCPSVIISEEKQNQNDFLNSWIFLQAKRLLLHLSINRFLVFVMHS